MRIIGMIAEFLIPLIFLAALTPWIIWAIKKYLKYTNKVVQDAKK